MSTRLMRKLAVLAVVLLLVAFVAQGLICLSTYAQTYDEACHLAAGYSYLKKSDFRLNKEHPCLMKLVAALPVCLWYDLPFDPDPELWYGSEQWLIGEDFVYNSKVPADGLLLVGRFPTLVFGTALVGLVGWWSYRLWGRGAACFATALAAFDPNLVAHSCLITTDVGAVFLSFLTLYLVWEYLGRPSPALLLAVGVSVGLALTAKYSTVVLVAIVPLLLMGHAIAPPRQMIPGNPQLKAGIGRRLGRALVASVLVALFTVATIGVCYSEFGISTWWDGFDYFLSVQRRGHPAFFLGQHSSHGWWEYFIVAALLKTPLGSLGLIAATIALPFIGAPWGKRELTCLLALPLLCFAAGTQARFNIGFRHMLPAFPFLWVAASRLTTVKPRRNWLVFTVLAIPVLATVLSSLRVCPHYLAYFNEAAGGPGQGAEYLSDSNIDWGQDLKAVKAYMDKEQLPMIYLSYFGTAVPEYYGICYQYAPAFGRNRRIRRDALPRESQREVLVISVVSLQGVYFRDHDLYAWLRGRTPVARIGSSILAYDLTGDADAHFQLARVYREEGFDDHAREELRRVLAATPRHAEALTLLRRLSGGAEME
jgi:hypothetical protein